MTQRSTKKRNPIAKALRSQAFAAQYIQDKREQALKELAEIELMEDIESIGLTPRTELQEEWGMLETKAMNYLEAQGYTLTKEWEWIAPDRYPTEKEARAVLFLIQEWDFGGVAKGGKPAWQQP